MPALPTGLYQWSTSLVNRVAPTAAEKISGFTSGAVAPFAVNDLIGKLSDAVVGFLLASVVGGCTGQFVLLAPRSTVWIGNGATVATAYLGAVTVTESGGSRSGAGTWDHVIAGGEIQGASVNVSAATTTSGAAEVTILVSGYDDAGTGPASGIWVGTVSGTGSLALSLDSGTATVYGPLQISVIVETGSGSGDTVSISSITLEY